MAYVRNCWYAAAWEDEFEAGTPVARTLLGTPMVMFRSENGAIAALQDRCPHRGVPLSMGEVVGDRIVCPYHGLQFDGTGTCVLNPHVKGNPGRLSTRAYTTYRKYGAVWLWHGDAERADPAMIPDFSYFTEPGYAVIHGVMNVEADFRLVLDNLLDLSHAEYIHRHTVGTPGSSTSAKTSVAFGDNELTVFRKVSNLPPSAVFRPYWNRSERIDQISNMTWFAPSTFRLNLGLMEPGGLPTDFAFVPADGFHFPSAHLLTPKDQHSTTYLYAVARNFLVDDDALSVRIKQAFAQTFEGEDRPILEAIQRRLGTGQDGEPFEVADFTTGDGAAARARRMIARLINEN